jgi:glutaredoxin 2
MRFVAERYLREVFADDVDDIAEQTTTVFAYKELKNDPFGLHVKHNGTATESLPKLVIYKKKKEIEIYKDDLTNQEQVIEWIHNTLETTPEIIAKEPIESDHDEL